MFFLYLLIALTAVAAAIFAAPLRHKVWTALALTAAGALWCSARARRGACRSGQRPRVVDPRHAFRRRHRLDGRAFGAVRHHHLGRRRRRRALLAGLPGPLPRGEIPGPHLAALHGAGGDVLRHAGRGPFGRRLLVPLFLGADDRGIVPADPLRRPAARGPGARRSPT